MHRLVAAGAGAMLLLSAGAVRAQAPASVSGRVALFVDAVPGAPGTGAAPDGASELRARAAVDARRRLAGGLSVRAALEAEGLVGDRFGARARAATVQPQEIAATWSTSRLDLTVGMGQVVWGRLDEFQPTDVVNPIDVTRFFFEGRAAARRAVGLARARIVLPGETALDAVVVPVFRRGTFDVLQESTSPFALGPREICTPGLGCLPVETEGSRPGVRAQGGARFAATTGRLDWAVMAWRGFESLPIYTSAALQATRPAQVTVTASHPRTTVVGGDVETVFGAVGLRAEAAWHVSDTLQAADRVAGIPARSLDVGAGLDRRAGDYRLSFTVLMTARRPDEAQVPAATVDRRDVQLVAAADRSFARDTRRLRVFVVHNPGDDSAFVRTVGSWSVRDGWWLEGSAGWFTGSGADTLSRLAARDFVSLSLTVHY